MGLTPGFMKKLEEFNEGNATTGELMAAASIEDEHVLAACAVSSHHLNNSEFPKAANCLVNALRLVRSPFNIAQLRLQQAIAYQRHKHPGIAIDLIDQGLSVLDDATDDTSCSIRKELTGLRQELAACAA